MTTPRIIASGSAGARDLSDGLYAELGYQGLDGLFEPAMVAKGASISTFDGPVRVCPQATYYEPRTFSLYGYLIGGSGQAEMDATAADFFGALSGPNTRFHVGSLYLDCNVTARPRYDRFRDFTTRRDYRLECEAIPALWGSEYHLAVGGDQGIYVRDDRLDHTSIKMTDVTANGRVVQFTYSGSAPTRCALMISGVTSGTTYYIVNPYDGRAVAFTPSAAVHYIPASAGPWLYPANAGANVLRLQSDTSGTLVASGTYLWALVPSAFVSRYLGNDGGKFTEGPVFSLYRRGGATYWASAAMQSAGDVQARIGTPTVATSTAGLPLEQESTNFCLQSWDFSSGTWSKINATVSDISAFAFNTARRLWSLNEDTTLGSHALVQSVTWPVGYNTISGFAKPGLQTWMRLDDGIVGGGEVYYNLAGAGAIGNTAGGATGTITYMGDSTYFVTFTRNEAAVAGAIEILAATGNGVVSYAGVGGGNALYLTGFQAETKPFATSHIATTTAAATRNADYCALYRPHNYLKYSRDLTQIATTGSNWIKSNSSISVARNQTAADGTASSNRITWNAVNDYIYQAVTPDCRPNSTPWTLVCAMRLGSMTGANAVALRIEDQGGTLIGSATTVTASDLSASETRTFFVTVAAADVASDDTGLRGTVLVSVGANSPDIEILGLLKGSFPGAPAHTEGSAIPLPQYGYDWPDWATQNCVRTFKALLPPISTGLGYAVIGDYNSGTVASMKFCLFRPSAATTGQNYLRLVVATDGTQADSGNIDVGAVWDGAQHTYEPWVKNYTSGGTQYMYIGLDVDGVNKYTSANLASATTTAFTAGEREYLSDSGTMATLRGVSGTPYYTMPTNLPAGAIPAT